MTRLRAEFTGSNPDIIVIRSMLGGDLNSPAGRDLDRRGARVLTAARERVGVRTGTLLTSGRRTSGHGPTGPYQDVTFGVRGLTTYLGYHMNGTGPHIIRARRRRALRFIQNGQVRFARSVRHPGTRANNFLVEALIAARG